MVYLVGMALLVAVVIGLGLRLLRHSLWSCCSVRVVVSRAFLMAGPVMFRGQ